METRFTVHLARFAAPEEMQAHSGQRGMCCWWMENGRIVTPERQVVLRTFSSKRATVKWWKKEEELSEGVWFEPSRALRGREFE